MSLPYWHRRKTVMHPYYAASCGDFLPFLVRYGVWSLCHRRKEKEERSLALLIRSLLKNSWWWTEELSETCRVPFQNKFEESVHRDARSHECQTANSSRCGQLTRGLSSSSVSTAPHCIRATMLQKCDKDSIKIQWAVYNLCSSTNT